jgi:hypothetical protein
VRAKGMVQKMLCRPVVCVGCPRDQNDRKIFSVRASDCIEGRKCSNAERDYGSGGAVTGDARDRAVCVDRAKSGLTCTMSAQMSGHSAGQWTIA